MVAKVVVAPDSFKGTLTAGDAAAAIAGGWLAERPEDEVATLPLADGGEGTLDAIEANVAGASRHLVEGVTGPDRRPVDGAFLLLEDGTAVVELALQSGLPLMEAPDPLGATTRGLGEVIARALDAGARRLLVGVGGSASTDAGVGALRALGLEVTDADNRPLPEGGGALVRAAVVDRTRLRPPPADGVLVLTDVRAPLLGPRGAAAVYGPQKGAGPEDVDVLEAALRRIAGLLGGDPDEPGAGAAGGTAYGFAAGWGARLAAGSATVADLVGLDDALADADLCVTGEGGFNETSLDGKVPGCVLERAVRRGVSTALVAGSIDVEPPAGTVGVSLADLAGSHERAVSEPARWLEEAGRRLARDATLR